MNGCSMGLMAGLMNEQIIKEWNDERMDIFKTRLVSGLVGAWDAIIDSRLAEWMDRRRDRYKNRLMDGLLSELTMKNWNVGWIGGRIDVCNNGLMDG
jgi:hypothetical protein